MFQKKLCPCSHTASAFAVLPKKSLGYIQVFLDGGLNQQRMGVCDAVAVAKILNATLVIPHFEVNLVWQDSRYFTHEIFSVIIFILEKRSSDVIFCEVHLQIYLILIILLMSLRTKFL